MVLVSVSPFISGAFIDSFNQDGSQSAEVFILSNVIILIKTLPPLHNDCYKWWWWWWYNDAPDYVSKLFVRLYRKL